MNLIPLAGEGRRYKKSGYTTPKPLIDINGVPMIVRAARALPAAEKYVFVCREEHVNAFNIDVLLRTNFPSSHIVTVQSLTEGQASTCLLAEPYINPEDELTIGACDNAMVWNESEFYKFFQDSSTDVVIWTFQHYPPVKLRPEMYGWVVVNNDGFAERVSVKVPVSDMPLNDHAVVGTFTFKRAGTFFYYAKKMIEQNLRINGEFYVDELMNILIESGIRVRVFTVTTYIGWGTPNELRTYQYWRSYFDKKNKP